MAKASQSYVGLARKWRPRTFDEMIGQPHAVDQLRLDVSAGRVKHAYLFSGPRGVGKTSMARILAKAMNCDQGPTATPCGTCDRCRAISDGFDVDTVEIDAATYTKVENIRDLQEGFNRAPLGGRWKVYIIDEVHMLSDSAFNALLKSLEEPPSRVIFVLATTNPEKIPETVQSRCTRIEFRRIAPEDIVHQLGHILDSEKSVHVRQGERETVLEAIAMASEGGLRDAEVALDQLISLGEEEITLERVQQLLGVVESAMLRDSVVALLERDTTKLLAIVHSLVDRGRDIQRFVKTLLHYLRDLLVLRVAGEKEETDALGVMKSRAGYGDMLELARRAETPFLLNCINQFLVLDERLRGVAPARFLLEFTFIKLAEVDRSLDLEEALSALTKGRGPSGGSGSGGAAGGRAPAGSPRASGSGRASRGAGSSTASAPATPARNRWSSPGGDSGEPSSPGTAPAQAVSTPAPSASTATAGPVNESITEPVDPTFLTELGIQPVGIEDAGLFWKSLLSEIRRRFVQISSALNPSGLLEIGNGVVRIGVPSRGGNEVAVMLLRRPDKKRDLEAVVSALAGCSMKVQIETVAPEKLGEATPAPATPSGSANASSPSTPADSRLGAATPHPTVPATPVYLSDPEEGLPEGDAELIQEHPADLPDWARDTGLPASQLHMVSFREAMRRYPDLREAVDLVQKAFKATPHDFNGRPIL